MHFGHKLGEQMQVDFAGDKLHYVDRDTGEVIACEVLVCALPYSNYTYAIALRLQKQEEFIRAICRALEYMGGVPESIKCDNLRSAVIKSSLYERQFTEAMEYVAAHYVTTILAARIYKPRDKSHVEKGVDLAYKRIYAPLRNVTSYSVEELNAAILGQLQGHNNRLFQGRNYSRSNRFENEKLLLKELPNTRYEMKKVAWGKVQKNYHIISGEDHHQYSVPFTLIGKTLKIVYSSDMVEIYDEPQESRCINAASRNADTLPRKHTCQPITAITLLRKDGMRNTLKGLLLLLVHLSKLPSKECYSPKASLSKLITVAWLSCGWVSSMVITV